MRRHPQGCRLNFLFRKLYPINVQEGCVVANRRAAVEIANLRSYPFAFLNSKGLSELHEFLAVETIVELCRRGDAIANARTLHNSTHIDVLSGKIGRASCRERV